MEMNNTRKMNCPYCMARIVLRVTMEIHSVECASCRGKFSVRGVICD